MFGIGLRGFILLWSSLIEQQTAVKEQEVLYDIKVYLDTDKPTLSYFEVIEIDDLDQTAQFVLHKKSLLLTLG